MTAQRMIANRAAHSASVAVWVSPLKSTIFLIVIATVALIMVMTKVPRKLKKAAMRTAGCAFIARVATQVAMALGASVQPLTKMTPSVRMTVMSSAGLSAICPMNQLKVKLDHAPVRFFLLFVRNQHICQNFKIT